MKYLKKDCYHRRTALLDCGTVAKMSVRIFHLIFKSLFLKILKLDQFFRLIVCTTNRDIIASFILTLTITKKYKIRRFRILVFFLMVLCLIFICWSKYPCKQNAFRVLV